MSKKSTYAEYNAAREKYIKQIIKKGDIFQGNEEEARKFLAIIFSHMLDNDEDFGKLVSNYRGRYIDRLLPDVSLL